MRVSQVRPQGPAPKQSQSTTNSSRPLRSWSAGGVSDALSDHVELPGIRVKAASTSGSANVEPGLATSDTQAGRAQTPAPAPVPAPVPAQTAPAAPSLALSNDSYTDSGKTSHKKIGFDVTVPAGLKAEDYCLVNKLEGSMKKADGTFHKVKMFGSTVDFNFTKEQVDSVDEDPVYWSSDKGRWNYTKTSGGFSATDDPGPPGYSFEPNDVAAVKFKIGLYKLADVQTKTTGSITATALQELPWQYSVKADSAGALSHPAL